MKEKYLVFLKLWDIIIYFVLFHFKIFHGCSYSVSGSICRAHTFFQVSWETQSENLWLCKAKHYIQTHSCGAEEIFSITRILHQRYDHHELRALVVCRAQSWIFQFLLFLPRTDHLGGVCRITYPKSRNHKKSIFSRLGLLSTKFELQLKC